MRKNKILISLAFLLGFSLIAIMPSCDLEDPNNKAVLENLGWFGVGGDNGDNLSTIQDDITFAGSGNLPASVNLTNFNGKNLMPPIGNQGQYGTCVAWATGYAHKGFLERTDGNTVDFSPKYLFWKVPAADKGADCNGTGFESAFNVMQQYGIATESTVPYTDLGDCSSSTSSSWDANAAGYKIQSFREISKDKTTLKEYLAQGRAISFGAKLGDEFMNASGSGVLNYQSYGYTGQHAYHAMILMGYDDSKNAFRVQNSWGTTWGDNGYIWVDQDYFIKDDFCFCAFVADNIRSNPSGDDNIVDDVTTGNDLLAWELDDVQDTRPGYESDPLKRMAIYNVFNSGTSTIQASSDWNILYVYYDAYDANNYGILLYDYYTDDYGTTGTPDPNDSYPNNDAMTSGPGIGNWWNYINVPSGQSVAMALYDGDADSRFNWWFTMPQITGNYYLVIIADGYNVITEEDEDNNYFFMTDASGDPFYFNNGIRQGAAKKSLNKSVMIPKTFDKSPAATARTSNHLNAYTPKEIQKFIEIEKNNGNINRKVQQFLKNGGNKGQKSKY